jgi:predicted nucleic acid-binding protein
VTKTGIRVAGRIAGTTETVHAPHLIDLEVAQALRCSVARRELDAVRAEEALEDLRDLDLNRHPHDVLLGRIWERQHNASAYDAAYLALAEAVGAPLLTSDARLREVPDAPARVEVL